MKEEERLLRAFQKTYIELDSNRIIHEDFYSKDSLEEAQASQTIPNDQMQKFDNYVQRYVSRHKGEFTQRGFSLPSRYQLQGKRSIVYKGVPILVLVGDML